MELSEEDVRNLENNGGPNYLSAWRLAKGLSQKDLAQLLHTTVPQLWFLEKGVRKITAKWLRRISAAIGVAPGIILDCSPQDPQHELIAYWSQATEIQREQILAYCRQVLASDQNSLAI